MSTPTTVSQAVATRDNGPGALIKQYSESFEQVLPTHVKPETWVRLAQGALKKGKSTGGRTDLEIAAANNPGVFLSALLDAARLGLEPGTEQYYLTPRKVKGQLEVLGIVGYQGHVELMYRAGAISSVIAEVVFANDVFRYQPGRDEIPDHQIDWDAEDRGALRLAYAYARMKDGAYSKVVVLNKAAVDRIKQTSQGSESQYSPWQQHPESMWLKSAVRQLQKWVPTSSEYLTTQARAAREARRPAAGDAAEFAPANVDTDTGEIHDAEVVDTEPTDWGPQNDDPQLPQ